MSFKGVGVRDCKVCENLSKLPKAKCEHRTPLESDYGFGRVSGWRGLGVTYRCPMCYEALWFEDDMECNMQEEIKQNDKKRKQNKKWNPYTERK